MFILFVLIAAACCCLGFHVSCIIASGSLSEDWEGCETVVFSIACLGIFLIQTLACNALTDASTLGTSLKLNVSACIAGATYGAFLSFKEIFQQWKKDQIVPTAQTSSVH